MGCDHKFYQNLPDGGLCCTECGVKDDRMTFEQTRDHLVQFIVDARLAIEDNSLADALALMDKAFELAQISSDGRLLFIDIAQAAVVSIQARLMVELVGAIGTGGGDG
jgi:hypothetical protein